MLDCTRSPHLQRSKQTRYAAVCVALLAAIFQSRRLRTTAWVSSRPASVTSLPSSQTLLATAEGRGKPPVFSGAMATLPRRPIAPHLLSGAMATVAALGLLRKRQEFLRAASAVAMAAETRQVAVELDSSFDVDIPKGTVSSMDDFMQQYASDVCIQNVQRIEPSLENPEVKYCWLEPQDMGPFRSQMRLTLTVDASESGRCDINILNMESGSVDKKTGEVKFDPDVKLDFKTENFVTWEDNGAGGLRVLNTSVARTCMNPPWWFPLPDAIIGKLSTIFIRQVVNTGMRKVNEQIKQRYSSWEQQ